MKDSRQGILIANIVDCICNGKQTLFVPHFLHTFYKLSSNGNHNNFYQEIIRNIWRTKTWPRTFLSVQILSSNLQLKLYMLFWQWKLWADSCLTCNLKRSDQVYQRHPWSSCWLIPSINMQSMSLSTLDRHLNWYSIDSRLTLNQCLDWSLISPRLTVGL